MSTSPARMPAPTSWMATPPSPRGAVLSAAGSVLARAALTTAKVVDERGPAGIASAVRDAVDNGDPRPRWVLAALAPVHVVARASTRPHVRRVVRAVQLLARGWADQDTWVLDETVCERLAGQLSHLARHGHVYPGEGVYTSEDVWTEDLNRAASALGAYAQMVREEDCASLALDAALEESPRNPDRVRAALAVQQDAFADRLAGAQGALRWVADNLTHLTD